MRQHTQHLRRKLLLMAAGGVASVPLASMSPRAAQAQGTAPRVVLLIAGSMRTQSDRVDAFRKRLRELGYTEGKNLIVELRELDGKVDQLPAIMREIVQSNPAVIVTHGAGTQAALVIYGFSSAELFGNAAVIVDRILKGRKPADLPFEQPMRFELMLNMKTAKSLGLKIPQTVLIRADRVIE